MEDDEHYFGSAPFVSLLFIYFPNSDDTLRAILTVLQIPSAAHDPVTRYAALVSLICAVMSLLYGYIIRFGMMRLTCRAAEWPEWESLTYCMFF